MIFVHRSTIGSTLPVFSGGNIGTTRVTHFIEALHPVEILAECERGDFDGRRIAAGFLRHVAEFRQHLVDIATWNPTVAIADRAPYTMRESAADVDRRVRLLHRLWPGDHRVEMNELAVVLRILLRCEGTFSVSKTATPITGMILSSSFRNARVSAFSLSIRFGSPGSARFSRRHRLAKAAR
jgi:hypothetical protein